METKNIKKTKRPVGRPKKLKNTLVVDLTNYAIKCKEDLILAIADAKIKAGVELSEFEKDFIDAEANAKKEAVSVWKRTKRFFKSTKNKISNWINK